MIEQLKQKNYQSNRIQTKLNKETGKFWSFKDTKHYKTAKYAYLTNKCICIERRFVFTKSYLLQVWDVEKEELINVVPLFFKTRKFPTGVYQGLDEEGNKIYFIDSLITKVY